MVVVQLVMETKTCRGCHLDKPLSEFYKQGPCLTSKCKTCTKAERAAYRESNRNKIAASMKTYNQRPDVKERQRQRRDNPQEREAARQRAAAWREEHRERDRQNARDYAATHREEAKRRTAEWKQDNPERARAGQADHYWGNAEREKEASAQYRAANTEKLRAYRRQRRREHADLIRQRERLADQIRRARKLAVPRLPYTMTQVEAKFAYWGNRCWVCGRTGALALDHVKPLARGGADMLCNFRPICKPCNSAKGAKWPLAVVLTLVLRIRTTT